MSVALQVMAGNKLINMELDKLKQRIAKLKVELAMSGYHDGWTLMWISDKLAELELRLKNIIKSDK